MTTLLHTPPPVHSNPPEPGPAARRVAIALGYPHCNLADAAAHRGRHGTVAGCPVVDPEDLGIFDRAFDADADGPFEPLLPFADWVECQAAWFRSRGSNAADWLAAEIQQLADLARVGPRLVNDRRGRRRRLLARLLDPLDLVTRVACTLPAGRVGNWIGQCDRVLFHGLRRDRRSTSRPCRRRSRRLG